MRTLEQGWAQLDLAEGIEKLNLHYLNGEIHVDVYLNKNYFSGHDQAVAQLRNIVLSHKNITQVEFYFHA
jgi:hypothetical protein